MGQQHQYEPCLNEIANSWQSRWSALRSITAAWYQIEMEETDLSPLPSCYSQAKDYSASIQQWILFREQVQSKSEIRVIRDDFVFENINTPASISLQVISEGNVCWAVLNDQLKMDDPPVVCLTGDCYGDYEEDVLFADCWELGWESHETVSEFALEQIAHKLRGERGGCSVEVKESAGVLFEAMEHYFQRSTWFGNTCIFESPDLFATVRGRQLSLEVRGDLELSDLPQCVLKNINHGGAFHGILVPVR